MFQFVHDGSIEHSRVSLKTHVKSHKNADKHIITHESTINLHSIVPTKITKTGTTYKTCCAQQAHNEIIQKGLPIRAALL